MMSCKNQKARLVLVSKAKGDFQRSDWSIVILPKGHHHNQHFIEVAMGVSCLVAVTISWWKFLPTFWTFNTSPCRRCKSQRNLLECNSLPFPPMSSVALLHLSSTPVRKSLYIPYKRILGSSRSSHLGETQLHSSSILCGSTSSLISPTFLKVGRIP